MTGSGSPCGACKFLRRKCIKGCVFAPYFCHEQGASHFSAIHRVFGASNVSKLLSQLPIGDRSEAAVTIAYEAQARLQDPIYGCVSHIFALQQQVVSLQSQLASLKEQAADQRLPINMANMCSDNIINNPTNNYGRHPPPSYQQSQDINNWFIHHQTDPQHRNSYMNMPQFMMNTTTTSNDYKSMTTESYENPSVLLKEEDGGSFSSFEEGSSYSIDSLDMQISSSQQQWGYSDHGGEDLQSFALGYNNYN